MTTFEGLPPLVQFRPEGDLKGLAHEEVQVWSLEQVLPDLH